MTTMYNPVFVITERNTKGNRCPIDSATTLNNYYNSPQTSTTQQEHSSPSLSHSPDSERKPRLLSPSATSNMSETHLHAITLAALNRFLVVLGVKSGRCQGVVSRLLEDMEDTLTAHPTATFTPEGMINSPTTTLPAPSPYCRIYSNEEEDHSGGNDSAREASLMRNGGPAPTTNTTASHSSHSLSTNAAFGSDSRHKNNDDDNNNHHTTPFDKTKLDKPSVSSPQQQSVQPSQPTLPEVSIDQFCSLLANILQNRLKDPFFPRGGSILTPTNKLSTIHQKTIVNGAVPGSWQEDAEDDIHALYADCGSPLDEDKEDPLTRHIRAMGRTLLWGCTPVVVLLAGTSGSGKSTLGSLLAQRLGIHTLIGTDAIREQLRHQIRHYETAAKVYGGGEVNPSHGCMCPLFYSTYEAHQGLCTATRSAQDMTVPSCLVCSSTVKAAGGHGNNDSLTSERLTHSPCGWVGFSNITPKGQQNVTATDIAGCDAPPNHQPPAPRSPQKRNRIFSVPCADDCDLLAKGGESPPVGELSATIRGYLAQCRPVQEVLTKSILRLVQSGESVVVEGVHITPQYMMELADTLNFSSSPVSLCAGDLATTSATPTLSCSPSTPSPVAVVCPFLIQIDKSDKHKERFAVLWKFGVNYNSYLKWWQNQLDIGSPWCSAR
jgi:hypothetical protein